MDVKNVLVPEFGWCLSGSGFGAMVVYPVKWCIGNWFGFWIVTAQNMSALHEVRVGVYDELKE